jgi:hypothetical protein
VPCDLRLNQAAMQAIADPAARASNIPPNIPSVMFMGLLGRTGRKPGTAMSTISAETMCDRYSR